MLDWPQFENDVESWIQTTAIDRINDVPRARFQRRGLAVLKDSDDIVGVAAWHDITRVNLEGIWVEVLAVAIEHQSSGHGLSLYELVVEHLLGQDRDGDTLAGAVHIANERSKRLLTAVGWRHAGVWDGNHELWIGSL